MRDLGKRGMQVRHVASGVLYRIQTGLPIGGEMASGVSTWVIRDNRLVLLADKPDRVITSHVGTITSRQVTYEYTPPVECAVIR